MSAELIAGGAALLLLLLGKKKKKKSSTIDSAKDGRDNEGSSLDGPTQEKIPGGGGSGGGSKGGGGNNPPTNLSKDAVWVSSDCKKVVFGDKTGELFWEKKGLPVAQQFIA